MVDLGCEMVNDGLKIDGDPTDAKREIAAWSNSITVSVG